MLDLILNGLLPPPSLDYEAQPTSESHSESSSDTAKSAGSSTIRIRARWAVGEACVVPHNILLHDPEGAPTEAEVVQVIKAE